MLQAGVVSWYYRIVMFSGRALRCHINYIPAKYCNHKHAFRIKSGIIAVIHNTLIGQQRIVLSLFLPLFHA